MLTNVGINYLKQQYRHALRAFLCAIVLSATFFRPQVAAATDTVRQPQNIVYIMLDDADYFDVGYNNELLNAPDAVTPNIDRLRAEGKAFTQFYSASAVCTPTRASMLTGVMPMQFGMEDAWPQVTKVIPTNPGIGGLPTTIPQLGLLFQEAGFTTAHHGKWHVGLSRPIYGHAALGFDDYSYYSLPSGKPVNTWHGPFILAADEGTQTIDVDYLDTYFADQVLAFIKTSAAKQQRFYVNYWPLSPHFPWSPPRNFDNSSTKFDLNTDRGRVLAMLYQVDAEIGRIVDQLEQLDMLDDTLIVVTSDNGGPKLAQNSEEYFMGTKGTLFEGGIHVPFLAHWPNGIPANSTSKQLMTTADLLPTFLELVGVDVTAIEKQIDGRSMAAAFRGDTIIAHDPILWEISGNNKKTDDIRAQTTYAIRDGDYILIKAENRNDLLHPRAYFLYDVVQDPQQKKNLLATEPALLARYKEDLLVLRRDVSQYKAFPTVTREKVVVPFDPRLEVTGHDLTLVMEIVVPAQLEKAKNLYTKPDSFTALLAKDRTINWKIAGSDSNNHRVLELLKSAPLTPGKHEIIFTIQGFKSDTMRAELFVDRIMADATYADGTESEIRVIWSAIKDSILGDEGLQLDQIRYYNNYFWLDEL